MYSALLKSEYRDLTGSRALTVSRDDQKSIAVPQRLCLSISNTLAATQESLKVIAIAQTPQADIQGPAPVVSLVPGTHTQFRTYDDLDEESKVLDGLLSPDGVGQSLLSRFLFGKLSKG